MSSLLIMLAVNFAIMFAAILVLWRIAVRLHSVSFIDAVWAYGIAMLAVLSAVQSGVANLHAQILLALTLLWGLRLGTYLLVRWRREGEDRRYQKILAKAMERTGYSWAKTALLIVFMLQLPLLYITSLPAQIGIRAAVDLAPSGEHGIFGALGWLGVLGLVAALVGILYETIADAQLKAFRDNPANAGKYLDRGLWYYSRHPNYFGDLLTWWGIWLVATDIALWVGLASLAGPLFLTFTLTKWSGVPMAERGSRKNRQNYGDYIARTSAIVPWPPRPIATEEQASTQDKS